MSTATAEAEVINASTPYLSVGDVLDRFVDVFGEHAPVGHDGRAVGPSTRLAIMRDCDRIPHRPSPGGDLARRDKLDLVAFHLADLHKTPIPALAYILDIPAHHVGAMIRRGEVLDRRLRGEPATEVDNEVAVVAVALTPRRRQSRGKFLNRHTPPGESPQ